LLILPTASNSDDCKAVNRLWPCISVGLDNTPIFVIKLVVQGFSYMFLNSFLILVYLRKKSYFKEASSYCSGF
jgi:hypothetical protein